MAISCLLGRGENTFTGSKSVAERTQVFISYSHRDTEWLQRLQLYLKPLEDAGQLSRWDDTQIVMGMKWRDKITQALARTRVAVLLVSDAFLASDFITRDELPVLLKAAEQDGALIVPVIVSPCRYERTPVLKEFQAANLPSHTLEEMEPAEWKRVLLRVSELIEDTLTNP